MFSAFLSPIYGRKRTELARSHYLGHCIPVTPCQHLHKGGSSRLGRSGTTGLGEGGLSHCKTRGPFMWMVETWYAFIHWDPDMTCHQI